MHRIDTPTSQKDKFGAGKNGFTRGNPQTAIPATQCDDDYFDSLQEEICRVVESAGITLLKGDKTQLLTALKKLFLQTGNNFAEIKAAGPVAQAAAVGNLGLTVTSGFGWHISADGTIDQWGVASGDSNGNATILYPIAFSSRPMSVTFCNLQTGTPTAVQNVVINNSNFDHVGFACRNLAYEGALITGSSSSFLWAARGK